MASKLKIVSKPMIISCYCFIVSGFLPSILNLASACPSGEEAEQPISISSLSSKLNLKKYNFHHRPKQTLKIFKVWNIPDEGELMPAPCLADPDVVVGDKLHGAPVPVDTRCGETWINICFYPT